MKLQLTKDYRIASDSRQWTLQKYAGLDRKTGIQVWQPIAYYSSLDGLVKGTTERLMREIPAKTLQEVQEHLNALHSASLSLQKPFRRPSMLTPDWQNLVISDPKTEPAATRQEARRIGAPKYWGKPCPRGHSGIRQTYSGACVECNRMSKKQKRQRNAS